MFWIIVIAVVVYFLYRQVQKKNKADALAQIAETMAHSQAMKDAMNMLTDISHLTEPCICTFEVNLGQYACEIDSLIEIIEIEDSGLIISIISDCERYCDQKIADTVAGKINQSQLNSGVEKYKKVANEKLAAILLKSYAPQSYPFLCLGEFLKLSENGNAKIHYPIVLRTEMRNQRPTFLRFLAEKSEITFSNCKVFSLDASSLTLKFYPE